jgi:hypothetical protein
MSMMDCSHLQGRVYWIGAILCGLCTLFIFFGLPETYAPLLLTRKAERLRKETGDDRYQSPMERSAVKASFGRLAYELVASPFVMLIQEPMLLATSVRPMLFLSLSLK